MMKNNRLHDKSFKKKFKESIVQLKKMMDANNISSRQKLLLSNVLDEYRLHTVKDVENASNIEPMNAWGQKDLHSILKERDEKIYILQREIEDVKSQNSKIADDRKRMKIETVAQNSLETLEKLVQSKNQKINELTSEIDVLMNKNKDLEVQISMEKETSVVLRDANKKLCDISNRKSSPVYTRDTFTEAMKYFDSENEILKYKTVITDLERDLSIAQENTKSLNERIEVLESIVKGFGSRSSASDIKKALEGMSLGDTESVLLEELENVTSAYDNVCSTNKSIEQAYSILQKKHSEVQNMNIDLKSRVKILEDTKQFVEKEKKRLDELKNTILEEAKLFEERVSSFNGQILEKDKKINDYKILLTTLQSNMKLLENEIKTIGASYRAAQIELTELKDEFKSIAIEHEDLKRICETYKNICTKDDIDAVEDLERCKRVLKCSLCDTNMKNCTISKCMHTFCESCLNDRLKARQRKCPNCQVEFNANDIKRIYF